jgi:antitoxin (DNA-binding transcriptional repressor) of toxin-antitoxin stability system
MRSLVTTLLTMRAVGIRELKSQLSSVLREVQRGETILVTDRGRVVAEIRRPGEEQSNDSPMDRALARMAARGEVRLAQNPGAPLPKLPGGPPVPPGTAQELIDWDRGA